MLSNILKYGFGISRKWRVEKRTVLYHHSGLWTCLQPQQLWAPSWNEGKYVSDVYGFANYSQISVVNLIGSWKCMCASHPPCCSEEAVARAGVQSDSVLAASMMWMIAGVGASRIQGDHFIMTVALLLNSLVLANFYVPIPESQRRKQSREKF